MSSREFASDPGCVVVIGCGRIGRAIEARLGRNISLSLISARDLVSHRGVAGLDRADIVIFTHGRDVNDRWFSKNYEEILASRIEPLTCAKVIAGKARRFILISSTTAALPMARPRSLPLLQRSYEACFATHFQNKERAILRVGTMVDDGFQLAEGLALLRRSHVLRRLRSSSSPIIPWADLGLLIEGVKGALIESDCCDRIVAYRKGFDVNTALKAISPGAEFCLPGWLFAMVWGLLGVRTEFLNVDLDMLCKTGWRFVEAPASMSKCLQEF